MVPSESALTERDPYGRSGNRRRTLRARIAQGCADNAPEDMSLSADKLRRGSLMISGAVFLMGAAVLIGWIGHIPRLTTLLPHLATMKANTAVGLMFAAVALALLNDQRRSGAKYLA